MNRKLYCLIPTRDYEYEELEKFLPLLPKQRRDKVMVSKSDSRKTELILSGLFMGYCFKRELGKNIADLLVQLLLQKMKNGALLTVSLWKQDSLQRLLQLC